MLAPTHEKPKMRNEKQILSESEELEDPIPLAVFHTDVPLARVWVRAPSSDDADKKPGSGGRRRKKEPPKVVAGTCAPGTYVLAVWWGRLCITQPSLELVCFLTKEGKKPDLVVKAIKPGEMPPATIELTPAADLGTLRFALPLGGKGADEKLTVFVTVEFDAEAGALGGAGEWKTNERVVEEAKDGNAAKKASAEKPGKPTKAER
jgi:hypothetical protein